jgi:fructose-1,6-bisphosphatase/inositol monophosphatase family enzyme
VTPAALLELFDGAASAVRDAVDAIAPADLRARTDRPGQYALDVVADAAACAVLAKAHVAIVSEESGAHGPSDSSITVVVDPVDGSTNCARGIAYWSTSLCALDPEGPLVAMVVNHASGAVTTAVRGGGAFRDGMRLRASATTRVEDSVIALNGWPARRIPTKQTRILGSIALELCDVAAGGLDAHVDMAPYMAPWDYLGGYLACLEAGATVRDAARLDLVTADPNARRQVVAAATEALADALEAALP